MDPLVCITTISSKGEFLARIFFIPLAFIIKKAATEVSTFVAAFLFTRYCSKPTLYSQLNLKSI